MDRRRFLKMVVGASISIASAFTAYRLASEYLAAPKPEKAGEITVSVIARDLVVPWSIVPIGDGRFLVSERLGRIIYVDKGVKKLIAKLDVASVGEAGLLGITVHPEFPSKRLMYAYLSYRDGERIKNRVIMGRLDLSEQTLTSIRTVVDGIPGASIHDGGRIRFGPDGRLYVTTGDAANRQLAQRLDSLAGKILRIEDDGSIPHDNPFQGSPVYSYGHRNPQGIDWHPDVNLMLSSEHGPVGHDEVNVIVKGGNYGWPIKTGKVGEGKGLIDPIIDTGDETWAPSGASFVKGDEFKEFYGNFMIACLRAQMLVRVRINGNIGVVEVDKMFKGDFGRLRDVVMDEEGRIVIATSNRDGRGVPRAGDDKLLMLSARDPL